MNWPSGLRGCWEFETPDAAWQQRTQDFAAGHFTVGISTKNPGSMTFGKPGFLHPNLPWQVLRLSELGASRSVQDGHAYELVAAVAQQDAVLGHLGIGGFLGPLEAYVQHVGFAVIVDLEALRGESDQHGYRASQQIGQFAV